MKVVLFGTEQLSSLAWYCLTHDSPHEVAGFTVDARYLDSRELHGCPVVAFEEIERHFPPDRFRLLVPLGYRHVNGLRAERYRMGKEKGYRFISYVSSRASVWPDLKLGENCMIYDQAMVQPFAEIGDNVVVRSGSLVSHHAKIGDHCFVAAQTAVGGGATIRPYSFLGLNSTVRDGVTVASRCVIAAGAVVTKDTEENGVYIGVPAKRMELPSDRMERL